MANDLSQIFNEWSNELKDKSDDIALKVAETARDFLVEQFDKQETPNGNNWAPLLPETVIWKRKHGYGSTPLVNTGQLRKALVKCIKEHRWNNIVLSVDLDYAEYQNDARQFIGEYSYELNKRLVNVLEEEGIKILK